MEPNEGTFVLHTENHQVDALEFLPNCRAASEYLYDILTNASVVKNKIPVLLCCNKTDKVTAHTKDFIRKQMEKEIEKLRASRSAVSTADIANDFTLGIEGEVFSFTHCLNNVTVAEASGLTGETDQILLAAHANDFNQDIDITWGDGRGNILNNGTLVNLALDQSSGSGFQSKAEYLYGKVDMQIKLVPGNSAGTVTESE
ncbi:unnamed protein product [Microthlaspi erraticum]|uniref:Signal recognition particle receptor subunit beta n=1 Tax=Microthlaspi erraticum TaxID=1685480 RepID=A0A6D2I2N4_9BRAS|nr:unnamed protein product [Microthlaspi erraticum]